MDRSILTSKGAIVTLWTLHKLRKSELVCESEKKRNLFDDVIKKKPISYIPYT